MPIIAVIGGTVLVFMAYRVGINAGNALWLPLVLAAIGAGAFALHLWHRRQLHRIHELYAVEIGNYYRLNMFSDWPKYCGSCGETAHNWKQVRAHDNEVTSPCMRLRLYLDSLEGEAADSLPMPVGGWQADVTSNQETADGAPPLPADTARQPIR